jgi:carbamate kinase
MSRTAVVAIGGNSLIKAGQFGTIAEQFANARETADNLAELVSAGWHMAIVHGNGPQVGFILRRSEVAPHVAPILTLDMCVADSQGGIGYILQHSLENALRAQGIVRPVATVITQVVVDAADAGFAHPTKPIGQHYGDDEAERLRREQGWQMVRDGARGWQRVVPSPQPRAIVEVDVIRGLVEQGVVTICAGGGGIPVTRAANGELCRAAAVVDKDRASALLARAIGAELFVISTSVERVALGYGTPAETPLPRLTLAEAERYLAEGQFPPGSMGPKIEAALGFLRDGGRQVLITSFPSLRRALHGETGTRIEA